MKSRLQIAWLIGKCFESKEQALVIAMDKRETIGVIEKILRALTPETCHWSVCIGDDFVLTLPNGSTITVRESKLAAELEDKAWVIADTQGWQPEP